MSNITTNPNNPSLSSHGTNEGISSQVDGAKNGSPIPNPVTTVPNHDNMSTSHRPSSSTDIPENIFIHKPTSTYMNGNIPSPTFMGTVNHSHSKPYPIPFSGQSNIPCAPFQHYLDPRMYPLTFNPIIMTNSFTPNFSTSTSTNNANTSPSTTIPVSHLTTDHKLRYITQPTQFPEWIRMFADYLRQNDLTHFIPNSSNIPITLSNTDKDYLVTVFTHYVRPTAYPNWFVEKLTKPYFTLAHAISLALYKHGKTKTGYEFAHELYTITFTPDTEIYDFRLRIHYLQEQCSHYGITVDEQQIIKSIICHLPPGYEIVGILYRFHPTTYKLNHVLDYIAATQEQLSYSISTPTIPPSSSPNQCQLCLAKEHLASSCPTFSVKPKLPKRFSTSKHRSKPTTKPIPSKKFFFKNIALKKVTLTQSYTTPETYKSSTTSLPQVTKHQYHTPPTALPLHDYLSSKRNSRPLTKTTNVSTIPTTSPTLITPTTSLHSSSTSPKYIKGGTTVPQSHFPSSEVTANPLHPIYKDRSKTNPFSTQYVKTSHQFSTESSNNLIHANINSSPFIQGIFNQHSVSTHYHTHNSPPPPSSTHSHNTISGGIPSANRPATTNALPSNNIEMNNENSSTEDVVVEHGKAANFSINNFDTQNKYVEELIPIQNAYERKRSQIEKLKNG